MLIVLVFLFGFVSIISGDCCIKPKEEWKGLTPKKVQYLCNRPVDLVIIQHTGTDICYNETHCMEIVRNIQETHMNAFKWHDIGFSFLVGGNGAIFEGSGWLHEGNHTLGYNHKSIGIAFIGNFNVNLPTNQALYAVQLMLSCAVEKGHLAPDYKLVGHSQLIATAGRKSDLCRYIRIWRNYERDIKKIHMDCVYFYFKGESRRRQLIRIQK